MRDLKMVHAGDSGKDWHKDYDSKVVTAEEAVKAVKPGDRVVYPLINGSRTLGAALADRSGELHDVTFHSANPQQEVGMFYGLDLAGTFNCTIELFQGDFARSADAGCDAKYITYLPGLFSSLMKPFDERPEASPFQIDVVMVAVSPPDKNGYCSFGGHLWNKRSYCQRAKTVIAEVNEDMIRTGGTNFIHVSEIDHFVEYTPPELTPELAEKILADADPGIKELVLPNISRIEKTRRHTAVTTFSEMSLGEVKGLMLSMGLGDPPPGNRGDRRLCIRAGKGQRYDPNRHRMAVDVDDYPRGS